MKKLMLALCAVFVLSACEQVDTGHRGVKTTFGKVDMEAGSLPEGLYFYNLFTSSISELDVRSLKWEDVTETYTKDIQQAKIAFTTNYRLTPDKAHIMYKEVGVAWADNLLGQIVVGQIKRVVGTYDAVDLIAKRGEAARHIRDGIITEANSRNIQIDNFELTDISYLPAFEKAVEDKVVATQRAVEAQNKTVQVNEEAKQTVIKATAEANSIKIKADALSANAKLVEYMAVEKWDGRMPQYMLGGATPMINLQPGEYK